MRCGFASAARLGETNVEANANDISAMAARRCNNPDIEAILLGSNQCIAVFRQRQYLPDADLNRVSDRNILRPLAGFALDRVDGIEADIERYALCDKALDQFSVRIVHQQQLDARTECHDLDCDL